MIAPDDIRQQLLHFTGTEQYHRYNPLFAPHVVLTDGAKWLADAAGCYWLMDLIAPYLKWQEAEDGFISIELILKPEGGFELTFDDGLDNVFATDEGGYTDFPLPEGIELFAQWAGEFWVIMLRTEY